MIGKQSRVRPTALGTLVQASTYGMTIPWIFGMTRISPLLIWAAHLRQGSCHGKKGKEAKKKGQPEYLENLDFLIGHNPILGLLRWWNDGKKLPLTFKTHDVAWSWTGSIATMDSDFYAVIGVSIATSIGPNTYSDYGNPNGSTVFAKTSTEIPLTNTADLGPDPADAFNYSTFPFSYRWRPDYGDVIYLDNFLHTTGWDDWSEFNIDIGTSVYRIYYAAKTTGKRLPNSALCISFEPQCGDGPEFDTTWASQQIIYPEYAGAGSSGFSLGAGATLPSLGVEVQGSLIRHTSGDSDFGDMIEAVMKSGRIQAGLNLNINDVIAGRAPVHVGLNTNKTPFIVQKKYWNVTVGGEFMALTLDTPVTVGNWIVVLWASAGPNGMPGSNVTDSLGNSYTKDFETHLDTLLWDPSWCIGWHTQVTTGGTDVVTVQTEPGPGLAYHQRFLILEIGGCDTLDGPTIVSQAGGGHTDGKFKIGFTSNNTERQPELLIAAGFTGNGLTYGVPIGNDPNWFDIASNYQNQIVAKTAGGANSFSDLMTVQGRVAKWPATYTWQFQTHGALGAYLQVVYGFYNSNQQAPDQPQNIPDILDRTTLNVCREAAWAGGLWGSIAMTQQRKAMDWLKDFYFSMNAWPVWGGFRLLSIARDEVSKNGNGSCYFSPTSSGPVADLDFDKGDFVSNDPPITVDRKAQSDAWDILQIQHMDRNADYNQVITSQPDPPSLAVFGPRKAAPEVHHEIQDPLVARKLLQVMIRRQTLLRNIYKGTLDARWSMLLPGDLVTWTDRQAGIVGLPVRLTSIEEQANHSLKCEAEPFVYGCHDPTALTTTASSPTGNPTDIGVTPANVNTPVIFEPVPPLYQNQNERELWIVVSDSDPNYGGSIAMISTDGGTTYVQVNQPGVTGVINGNGVTGYCAPWASGTSPDTTNDLAVDLTESLGALSNYSTTDEDNFVNPCYVSGGTANIPYELMTYGIAVLTSGYHYTLKATGTGNHLDRSVFGAPHSGGVGVSHSSGARFAFLANSAPGILKMTIPDSWIGLTLHFKFLAFNTFGGGQQDISTATDYTYTVGGTVGSVNPGGVPPEIFAVN